MYIGRAPSTSANLGSGFDVVAVAHDAYFAEAYVSVGSGCGVYVKFKGFDPGPDNTVVRAFDRLFASLGICRGVEVEVVNNIPIARGLGSSGASAVAALSAFVREAGLEVDPRVVVEAAGHGESAAAGSPHFDNVAGAAFGGAVVITSLSPLDLVRFSPRLTFVVGVPEIPPMPNKTKAMREVLPKSVEFPTYVRQISRVAALVAGLARSDPGLVARGMQDEVVEAARAPLVPGYGRARKYALEAGALAVALSGAGPSVIALVDDKNADAVKDAVLKAYAEEGLKAEARVASIAEGALGRA
ncbi:MAG: homoserine kinase [Thermoproteus sp.]